MIGGEFSIAVTDILNAGSRRKDESNVYKYASGRGALYQILKFFWRILPDLVQAEFFYLTTYAVLFLYQ